jgi:hypothetical protein
LGVALVAAQAQLTSVRTAILEVSSIAARANQSPIPFLESGKGYDLFRLFNDVMPTRQFFRMEAINAIANYWKHHEEWPTKTTPRSDAIDLEWDPETAGRQSQSTIGVVTALGMSCRGTQNIQEALRTIGVSDPSDLALLRAWIDDWSDSVLREAEK